MSAKKQPKFIPAREVKKLLTWPLVNKAVEEALKAINQTAYDPASPQQSYAVQTTRSMTACGDTSKLLICMPGFVGNYESNANGGHKKNTIVCKLGTSFSTNQNLQPPLPNISAHILLFDNLTGQLQCTMDGTQITAWRTAAASIVATKYLYIQKFPEGAQKPIKLAIIGCGVQGESHALGMCHSFNVIEVYLYNRTKSKAEQLASKLHAEYPTVNVNLSNTPEIAVQEADVVCVGTYSANALISYSMLKRSEVHINTVGAGEIHFGEVAQDIYDQSAVYVDSMLSAKVELKDLKTHIIGEIGEVIRGDKITKNERITVFQSMGIAAEDATVAQAIYDVACMEQI